MMFLKHKKFKDVCVQLYNYEITDKTITLYGEYWNVGINVSHRIGEYVSYNLSLKKFYNEWDMCINLEKGRLPKLRNANWMVIDFELLNEVK